MLTDIFLLIIMVTGLLYTGWLAYSVWEFKKKSLAKKAIGLHSLYKFVWRFFKISIGISLLFFVLQFAKYQIEGVGQSQADYSFIIFCFSGLMAYCLFFLFIQILSIQALWNLPFINE